ncbi:hypothetical protein U1Q18_024618 [Sarracenia purpurea var. burkii]
MSMAEERGRAPYVTRIRAKGFLGPISSVQGDDSGVENIRGDENSSAQARGVGYEHSPGGFISPNVLHTKIIPLNGTDRPRKTFGPYSSNIGGTTSSSAMDSLEDKRVAWETSEKLGNR